MGIEGRHIERIADDVDGRNRDIKVHRRMHTT
jgi:hypothetical protein